jgi:branched-chain amino acid transport system ATP-binding protein
VRRGRVDSSSSVGGCPLLELVDVTSGYDSVPVIRGVSLSVGEGELVALIGANGAGKTTTLMTIAGVLKPSSGQVRWLGRSSSQPLHVKARTGLAYVTEERSVIPSLTTLENLRLGGVRTEDAVGLFPELKPLLGRRAGLLSGGEQQILSVARALARGPRLLLADELSLGLAPIVVARLLEAIHAVVLRGVGVLLVEQRLRDAVEYADRVVLLRGGRVLLNETAAAVRGRIDEVERSYFLGHADGAADESAESVAGKQAPGADGLPNRSATRA